jgi:CheY-like chemotaxis protein
VLAATVLVADDDADILRFMEINLRLEGFEVVTARDGPDALAKAAAVRPDLVLLDVRMPGIDGYTICARIRADAPRGIGAAAVILVPGGAAIASRAGWSFPPSFHRPQPDRTRSHSLDSTPDVTCETTSRQILPDDQHTPPKQQRAGRVLPGAHPARQKWSHNCGTHGCRASCEDAG